MRRTIFRSHRLRQISRGVRKLHEVQFHRKRKELHDNRARMPSSDFIGAPVLAPSHCRVIRKPSRIPITTPLHQQIDNEIQRNAVTMLVRAIKLGLVVPVQEIRSDRCARKSLPAMIGQMYWASGAMLNGCDCALNARMPRPAVINVQYVRRELVCPPLSSRGNVKSVSKSRMPWLRKQAPVFRGNCPPIRKVNLMIRRANIWRGIWEINQGATRSWMRLLGEKLKVTYFLKNSGK